MHRADPFMLDEEIAEDGEAAAPQRPPLPSSNPPAQARTEQATPAPEPTPEREVVPPSEPASKPEPQVEPAKPIRAAVRRTPGKRGRPKSANPKRQITLRLDAEVVDHFRAKGRGWQTRINSALREAAGIED